MRYNRGYELDPAVCITQPRYGGIAVIAPSPSPHTDTVDTTWLRSGAHTDVHVDCTLSFVRPDVQRAQHG